MFRQLLQQISSSTRCLPRHTIETSICNKACLSTLKALCQRNAVTAQTSDFADIASSTQKASSYITFISSSSTPCEKGGNQQMHTSKDGNNAAKQASERQKVQAKSKLNRPMTDEDFKELKQRLKQKDKNAKLMKQQKRLDEYLQKLNDEQKLPGQVCCNQQQTDVTQAILDQILQDDNLTPKAKMEKVRDLCDPVNVGLAYEESGMPRYGTWHNSMFLKLRKPELKIGRPYRFIDTHLSGPRLIFDFSYDEFMNRKELSNLATQVSYCLSLVQTDGSANPFAVYFANLATGGASEQMLVRTIGNLYQPSSANVIGVLHDTYLNHFSREKLIYLSPHAEEDLLQLEPDANYIIGGFVDQSFPKPLSYKKACAEGIRSYRLPLDVFLHWKMGCKYLPLTQVTGVLINVKNNINWKIALSSNVRKMYQMDEQELEEAKQQKQQQQRIKPD